MKSYEVDKKLVDETDFIHRYIRDWCGDKVGVVVALMVDDTVCSGWSLCSELDTFGNVRGKAIAIRRAKAQAVCEKRNYRSLPLWWDTIIHRQMENTEQRLGDYLARQGVGNDS